MGVRWHNGPVMPEDPHAAARRLQTQLPGYKIWYGSKTHHFYAIPSDVNELIEAATTSDLIEKINSRRLRL